MVRNILIVILFLLITVGGYSQRETVQNLPEYDYEPYHFGFLLGVNRMGFSMKQDYATLAFPNNLYPTYYQPNTQYISTSPNAKYATLTSVEPVETTGFSIGIIGNLRLSDHFDLRAIPTLSFGERLLSYHYNEYDQFLRPIDTIPYSVSIKSTFLELPVHLKYKGNRINNARPYIIGGGKIVYDLGNGIIKHTDIYGELGAGFDFYFEWFKMGVEAKMSYGLKDIVNHNSSMYINAINRLNSKVFQLSVTFE
ncbi:MAG: PorT family protein [Bacteroidetes bacterium]|nr:PorT family protein [Bacteroidota bacterium]